MSLAAGNKNGSNPTVRSGGNSPISHTQKKKTQKLIEVERSDHSSDGTTSESDDSGGKEGIVNIDIHSILCFLILIVFISEFIFQVILKLLLPLREIFSL